MSNFLIVSMENHGSSSPLVLTLYQVTSISLQSQKEQVKGKKISE